MILYLILGILVCCIIVLIAVIWQYRKKTLLLYDSLLQKLDIAISGESQNEFYDESFDSAITERLNRMIQISSMRKKNAEDERDVVKSLISDISHQIRTPLSNIILYVGLLKETNLNKKELALADKIESNSEKLDFFMKELIKSSCTEQEIIHVSPELVSVSELVNKACQSIELAALKKNIVLCISKIEGICYADIKWTVEAVGNVLENAIKYSPENSKVHISTILYESFICIQIKDFGIGIAEEEQGKIFQRFYRGKNVNNSTGFGIGLYLTREVLAKQGGYVKVNSKLDKGTTVRIFLSRHSL